MIRRLLFVLVQLLLPAAAGAASVGNDDGCENPVVTTMQAEGRFLAAMDAPAMGNGCSAPFAASEVTTGTTIIGPARKP